MYEAPRTEVKESDGLGELKTLLFRGESARLKAVESSVEALDTRLGDASRLEASTSEILVEALRRAEVARHRELAQAIAPVVVAAIQNEIRNSREMMVEALYPLTGQLVVAAVSNAFREMLASINEKLDSLTSMERWRLKLRARLTGRPIGELAMASSTNARIVRALFLEHDSGALIASWRADGLREERGELIGGLIAALTVFARDALGENGELRTLEFGGRDIFMRASPTHIVAVECSGPLRMAQREALDRDIMAWLDCCARDGLADDKAFGSFFERAKIASPPGRARSGLGWPFRIIAVGAALLCLALLVRAGIRGWRESELRVGLARVFDQRPALAAYPLAIKTDHAAGRIELNGIAPSSADVDALLAGLRSAAGNYTVEARVGVVATDMALTEELARARADISNIGGRVGSLAPRVDELRAKIVALEQAAATDVALAAARATDGQTRLSSALAEVAKEVAEVQNRVDALASRAVSPRARLSGLLDGFAIFFATDKPLPRPNLDERLDAIAKLLAETDINLRIIGYADETGSPTKNLSLSRDRAESVAALLAARGAPRDRLFTVGRGAADPIAPASGDARFRNRRAVIEPTYDGEIAQ